MPEGRTAACSSRCRASRSRRLRVAVLREGLGASGRTRGLARPGGAPARESAQQADSRKAVSTSRHMMRDSATAMDSSRAAMEPSAPAPPAVPHPPVILRNGPRDYSVATWLRDENGEPIYKVVQRGINAASTAGVLARKLMQ